MSKSWITGGRSNGEAYADGTTAYFRLSASIESDQLATTHTRVPEAMTLRKWAVRCAGNTLTGNATVLIFVNGTDDSDLSVTFATSDADVEKRNTSDTLVLAADDTIVGKAVCDAGGTSIVLSYAHFEVDPTNSANCLTHFAAKAQGSLALTSAGSVYVPPFGIRLSESVESDADWTCIDSFEAVYFSATSGNNLWTADVTVRTRKNGANGGSSVVFTSTDDQVTKYDTSGSDTLVDGSTFNYEISMPAGSGTFNLESAQVWLRNTSDKFLIATADRNAERINANLTRYFAVGGEMLEQTGAESVVELTAPFDMTITAMQVLSDLESMTGDSVVTLRLNNAATELAVTFNSTATGILEDTGSVSVTGDTDALTTQIVTGGGTNRDFNYVVYLASAGAGGGGVEPEGDSGLTLPTVVLECLRPSSVTYEGGVEFGSGSTPYAILEHPSEPYLFVVIGSGITVIDITTRSAPSVVGAVTDAVGLIGNQAIHGLCFDGTGRYLYATSGTTSLYTFDLGAAFVNIEDPALVDTEATLSAGGNLHVLTLHVDVLLVLSDSANNFQQYDISTPQTPALLATTAATTIALGCQTGFVHPSLSYVSYPSGDNSGKIGSINLASPASQAVFQLPTYGSGGPQIKPQPGITFVGSDLLCLVVSYTANGINHYFWMAIDTTTDLSTNTPILTETSTSGVINTITAPIIASSPFHVSSVGTYHPTYTDFAVFIRDDSAGNVGEVRFYRLNADSTLQRARVPRLVAAAPLPNSYSLRCGYGADADAWHAVAISADRSNAVVTLFSTDLLSFTDDDAFANLTPYLLMDPGVRVSHGIRGLKPDSRVASPGSMEFELDNSQYNPAATIGGLSPGAASPIFADFVVGAQARLTVGGDVVFRGLIKSIETDPNTSGPRRVKVECVDIFDALTTRNANNVAAQTNATVQEVIETLLDSIPPLPGCQGLDNLDFEIHNYVTGAATQEFEDYDYAFDRAYDERTVIVGEIQKVMNSERGYIYLVPAGGVPGGLLRFQSIDDSNNEAILTPVFDYSVLGVGNGPGLGSVHARENIYNIITVRIFPRKVDTAATTVLFTLQSPTFVRVGQTLEINAAYRDPAGLASRVGGVDMVAPAVATDYTFRAQKTGGTNLNTQLSVSAVFGGSSAKILVTNNGPRNGWLVLMQLRGKGVYSQEPILVTVSNPESVAIHGPSELRYDMQYTTDPNEARALAEALLEVYQNPRTFIEWIEWTPNRSAAMMTQFLAMRIGSKIAVQDSMHGMTDTDYWTLGTTALSAANLYGLDTFQVQKLSFTIRERNIITAKAELIPSAFNFQPSTWNEPRNWSSEIMTAALLQQQLSDNANDLYRVVKRQTADVASTSTTFSDLTGMEFDALGGETYLIWVTSFFVSDPTPDVKYTVLIEDANGTAAATYAAGEFGVMGDGAPVGNGHEDDFGSPVDYAVGSTAERTCVVVALVSIIVDCTVKIQGAQRSASGTTTFRENSFMAAFRMEH